jgi:hypothetical protein
MLCLYIFQLSLNIPFITSTGITNNSRKIVQKDSRAVSHISLLILEHYRKLIPLFLLKKTINFR